MITIATETNISCERCGSSDHCVLSFVSRVLGTGRIAGQEDTCIGTRGTSRARSVGLSPFNACLHLSLSEPLPLSLHLSLFSWVWLYTALIINGHWVIQFKVCSPSTYCNINILRVSGIIVYRLQKHEHHVHTHTHTQDISPQIFYLHGTCWYRITNGNRHKH